MKSVGVGVLMACLVGTTTVYVGLKTPFTMEGSIPSAVFAFVLMAVLNRAFSLHENNLSQTLASAAGSTGSITAFIPALLLLGYDFGAGEMVMWMASVAFLGVFFAVPLRNHLVVDEKLPFPAGTACAITLKNLHSRTREAIWEGRLLLAGAGASGVVTWFRDGIPKLIPDSMPLRIPLGRFNLAHLGFGIVWYPVLLGAGALVGPKVGTGILVGLGVWVITALAMWNDPFTAWPQLYDWLLWPGVALLIASGVTTLLLHWRALVRGILSIASLSADGSGISLRIWLSGLALTSTLCVTTMVLLFGVPVWVAVLSVPVSFILTAVSVRVYGETGVHAVGPFSHAAQFLFGGLFSQSAATIVLSSGVTGAASQESGDMLNDLKTGHLVNARPGQQFVAQLIGVAVGVAIAVPIFQLLVSAYGLASEQLPMPAAQIWVKSTTLLAGLAGPVEGDFLVRILVGGGVGVVLALLQKTGISRFLPSTYGIGFALILPPSYSLTLALGALLAWALGWRSEVVRKYTPATASGLIAGEAVVGVATAAIQVAL